jgi:plastocyanin
VISSSFISSIYKDRNMNSIFTRHLARPSSRSLRTGIAAVLLSAAALVTPPILGLAAAAPTAEIDISKFAYGPKEITVTPGTKIVWTNHDETPHTVTSSDKSFASKGMDTDDKFEHTFASEGDFTYICTVHPFMTGVVHVHKK